VHTGPGSGRGVQMTLMIADRFLASHSECVDGATGLRAQLHVAPAGSVAEQMLWSSRCAAQANLRHPLLNPLLDFGLVDRSRTFEAYMASGPVQADVPAAQALLTHAVRFLEAHGIELTLPLAAVALRKAVPPSQSVGSASQRLRFIGVVLQRRTAMEAIVEALAAVEPAGACAIRILGLTQSGLRTLRILAARAARLQGYMPVDAAMLHRHDDTLSRMRGRHVCILADEEDSARVAAMLTRLASDGGRRHIVLLFGRSSRGSGPAVALDPMSLTGLTAMVFAERDFGPSHGEILDAARGADGRPGLLLARLGAQAFEPAGAMPVLVRETAPLYEPSGEPAIVVRSGARRTAAVLLRSASRAQRLARAGRHAAAARLLARAIRLLIGRGDPFEAARCALVLGSLQLDRGQTSCAIAAFDQARELAADSRLCVEASIGLGAAHMEDGRLIDAEGVLRTALLAATGLGEPQLAESAAAALAECLRIQGRPGDAAAMPSLMIDRQSSAVIAAAAARVHLALGQLPAAVRAGRQAVELSAQASDPRAITNAHRALAEALAAAGDSGGARAQIAEGLSVARQAHLPIQSLRLRIVELAALQDDPARRRTQAGRLESLARHGVPRLLQSEIKAACAQAAGAPLGPDTCSYLRAAGASGIEEQYASSRGPVAELEMLIELCHTAPNDRTAIERVCAALCERLRAVTVIAIARGDDGRVLAHAGRAWQGDPILAQRVLATGIGVPPDPRSEPAQAAEPVRYGGEVVAALAARWSAGTSIDSNRASALLRVGALAVAASVRAVLDRADPRQPQPRPDDIIGTSEPVRALRDAIARAARAPFPVLIEGESGSGKELVARAIHRLGPRRDRRFCPINCAALTDELLEAELFGHVRGAFTGAVGERPGLFEDADGGTIFLDEIGELSARAQAKLLRVLQDGEVRRVGENISRRVDVRVVAATNRRLAQESAAGRFRVDLRFRLDVVRLDIPPLRERSGDVPLLAAHFWADAAGRVGSQATLAPETLAALARYDWPGNVRELQNVMAWIAVQSPRRGRIGAAALPAHVAQSAAPCSGTFEAAREEFERRFVRAALAAANGQRASAASAIGISRQGLAKMLRRLGIEGA
jgi:DNA-binding NtrC family response regulator/tetratricopeptide (TPR) repeat protein